MSAQYISSSLPSRTADWNEESYVQHCVMGGGPRIFGNALFSSVPAELLAVAANRISPNVACRQKSQLVFVHT